MNFIHHATNLMHDCSSVVVEAGRLRSHGEKGMKELKKAISSNQQQQTLLGVPFVPSLGIPYVPSPRNPLRSFPQIPSAFSRNTLRAFPRNPLRPFIRTFGHAATCAFI